MSGLKIVVIGGGSSYTPELIEGFAQPLSRNAGRFAMAGGH